MSMVERDRDRKKEGRKSSSFDRTTRDMTDVDMQKDIEPDRRCRRRRRLVDSDVLTPRI